MLIVADVADGHAVQITPVRLEGRTRAEISTVRRRPVIVVVVTLLEACTEWQSISDSPPNMGNSRAEDDGDPQGRTLPLCPAVSTLVTLVAGVGLEAELRLELLYIGLGDIRWSKTYSDKESKRRKDTSNRLHIRMRTSCSAGPMKFSINGPSRLDRTKV